MRQPFLKRHSCLVCLAALTTATFGTAAPTLRTKVDQHGDFILFGNTLGWDCGQATPTLPAGTTLSCTGTSNIADTATDIYWRSEDDGTATATAAITMENARSTSELKLPVGATVTYARLYWAALQPDGGSVDNAVVIDRPGNIASLLNVTADQTWTSYVTGTTGKFWYQGTADVTAWMKGLGPGAFRVGGVASIPDLYSYNDSNTMAGWSCVVFYELASEPSRNLAIFDGLDTVNPTTTQTATISGFLVPAAFDAKLGVVAYEGDVDATGDSLSFGPNTSTLTTLTNALNPANNFFNSTRSHLATGVSNALDRPQLPGTPGSMGGVDLDVVDVKSLMTAGQTSATIRAASTGERIGLATLVTSISTFKPDFSSSGKTVTDVNGGALVPGDELEYTVVATNTGNDTSVNTVMNDVLPTQVTYVAGSVALVSPTAAALTDTVDADTGEYVAGTRTVTVRLGSGANGANGGTIATGASVTVKFRVTLNANATGIINNQAVITAGGALAPAATPTDYPTDGNGTESGTPPTSIGVDADSDGLPDATEIAIGTNPNDADSDDDGVLDGAEPSPGVDTDGDGLINALDPDSDNDGLFDGTELGLGCSNAATNQAVHNCVPDADSGATKTDPLNKDTDGGSVTDGSEDVNLNGRVDSGETDPTAGHGADDVNAANADTDGDGLTNGLEATLGSNPNDKDTDDDGVPDGQEPNPSADGDGDGLIDVLDSDSDNDGLFDGTEMGLGCSNTGTDTAKGQCIADVDTATHTSAVDPDTDNGGVRDGAEDVNHNGRVDGTETNPVAGQGADDINIVNADTDGDGLTNAEETALGSDPYDADSDDDGLADGQEANPSADTDGDGAINVRDPDSDGDGLYDGTEAGKDCSGTGTSPTSATCIADADNTTTTSPVDPDTDNGGITDGAEDTNHNGRVDSGERNPNNRTDDGSCTIDSECNASVTSGRVCSAIYACADGCRGSGGNGCPSGEVCSSTTTALGTCSAIATGAGGAAGAAGAPAGTGGAENVAGAAGTAVVTDGGTATGGTATGGASVAGAKATGGALVAGAAGAKATGGAFVAGAAGAEATGGATAGGAATGGVVATAGGGAEAGSNATGTGGTVPAAGGAETSAGGAANGGTTAATGGQTGAASDDDTSLEGGGCNCAVPGKQANSNSWLLALVAGLLGLRRKRSRR